PGISRDGIVTVTGMARGMRRSDAVRFSFLLSAPVILAAGALKAKDLTGPMSAGIHGPILVGSLVSGVGAYLSIRFLTKYFSEDKSLNPFGIYCLIAGLGAVAGAELGHDVADVGLRRQRAEVEADRDFLVGQALGDERQHLTLTLGEPGQVRGGPGGVRRVTPGGGRDRGRP